ncbi:MAG: hypothetical protein MUF72_17640 [Elainella sp. Prado103]|nr:hypothetical protein [Elainella sp. Prado103]
MSCGVYKTISQTLKAFQIVYTEANFIVEAPFQVSDYFREDLQLMMRDGVVDNSEFAICENLIYPILKEVWKLYRSKFILWSYQSLNCDTDLCGFPEYILGRTLSLSKTNCTGMTQIPASRSTHCFNRPLQPTASTDRSKQGHHRIEGQ